MASPLLVDSAYDYPFSGGTVPWPASVPEGDLIVIQITSQITGDTITLDDGTYTALPSHGSSSRQNQTFFKTAGASESAPIYNAATSTRCVALTLVVSGGTLVYDDSLGSWNDTAVITFPSYTATEDFLAIKRAWSNASTSLVSGPTEGTLIHDSLSGGRGHAAWQLSGAAGEIATDSITTADQHVQSGNLLVFENTGGGSGGSVSIESVGGDNSLQVGETGAITRLVNGDPASTIQSIDIGGEAMTINGWTAE